MSKDIIYRQDAIDEVVAWLRDRMTDGKNGKSLTDRLKDLPSAQPEWTEIRRELIDWARKIPIHDLSDGKGFCRIIFVDDFLKSLEQLPSVQPGRKKGKWIKEYWNGEHTRKCSACNITQTVTTYRGKVNFNYCPYCGADMRSGDAI